MSLTRLKKLNKLGNAHRAKAGIKWKTPKGIKYIFSSDAPRNDDAVKERIKRWEWRLKH